MYTSTGAVWNAAGDGWGGHASPLPPGVRGGAQGVSGGVQGLSLDVAAAGTARSAQQRQPLGGQHRPREAWRYSRRIWQASEAASSMENGRNYKAPRRVKAIRLFDWPRVPSPFILRTRRAPSAGEPLSCARLAPGGDEAGWGEKSGGFLLL